jgi:phospholipid transport system transporter-binding protein
MDNKNLFKPGLTLTFNTVVSVRKAFNKAIEGQNTQNVFCLNLSEVTQCDSAGLAFLIDARKRCKQKNIILEIRGMTPEIESLAEFCGVKSILECV